MTIAPDLTNLLVPIDELSLFPGNPRQGDVDAIARSLEVFGQRKPIVATREGVVVAGNHTLLAAQRLGWTQLAVVRVDDDDTMAQAYALADNRTAELGGYDVVALAEMIQAVQEADEKLLAAISYDTADLDDFLAAIQEVGPEIIEHSKHETRYGGRNEDGSYVEPSMGERLELYQSKGVRSIVLDYDLDRYEAVAEMAARLRNERGLTSTAELFLALLHEAVAALG